MLPRPGRRAVVDLHRPGRRERARRRRTSPRPTCPATRSRPARSPACASDQGFLGGGPFFASLYGSQLRADPGQRRARRATPARSPCPTSGDYTFALTGWGEAADVPRRRAGDRLRHRRPATWRRRAPATLSLEAGERARGRDRVPGDAARSRAWKPASLQLGWTHPANAYSPDIAGRRRARRASRTWRWSSPPRYENEQRDRASLTLPNDQDQLIRAVSAVNPNTVVVLGAAGPGADAVAAAGRRGRRLATSAARSRATRSPTCSSATSTRRASCRSPSRAASASPSSWGSSNPWDTRDDLTVAYDEGVFVGYAAMTAPAWTRCSRSGTGSPTRSFALPQPRRQPPGRRRAGAVHRCATPGGARAPRRRRSTSGSCPRACRRRPSSSPGSPR